MREVGQQPRSLTRLAQNRTLFICFDISFFIGFYLVVWFEEVPDIGLVDRPQRFLNAPALFSQNFFLLPDQIRNTISRTSWRRSSRVALLTASWFLTARMPASRSACPFGHSNDRRRQKCSCRAFANGWDPGSGTIESCCFGTNS